MTLRCLVLGHRWVRGRTEGSFSQCGRCHKEHKGWERHDPRPWWRLWRKP